MRVAPLPLLRERPQPARSSSSSRWLGRQSSSVSISDSDSDESSSRVSYYSTLSRDSHSSFAVDSSNLSVKSLPDASAPHQHGCAKRWLYRHPRVAFSLILALSAIATGAYSSYFFATLSLKLAGAPSALARVRTQLVATELTLTHTTHCGLKLLTPRITMLKTQLETETAPWKNVTHKYTAQQVTGRANLRICEERELATYTALVDENATTTREQLDCLVDGIQQTLDQHQQTRPSTSGNGLMTRLEEVVRAARSSAARNESRRTMDEMVENETNTALIELDKWLHELRQSLAEEFQAVEAKIIPPKLRGSVVTSAEKHGGDGKDVDAKDRLVASLRAAVGKNHKRQRLVDEVEAAWDDMALATSQQEQRGAQYRDDLTQVQNATLVRLQQSVATMESAISTLRETIASQTRSSISTLANALVERVIANMQKLLFGGEPLQPSSEQAKELDGSDAMPQPGTDWDADRGELVLHFDELDRTLHEFAQLDESTHVEYAPDPRTFRASLLEVSSVLVTIVLTYDFLRRATWLLAKIASLMTESYTDLPPVDIRDSAAITTLLDCWGVVKGRYDFGSVVFSLLNESSYVVKSAIHFVLWVLVEIAGTTAFVGWRREFTNRCRPEPGQPSKEPIDFNFLKVLELVLGELTKDGLTPLQSVQLRSTQLRDAFDKAADDWQQQIHATAETHTKLVSDLLLERRLLVDLRANLVTCALPVDASELNSEECSLSAFSQSPDGYETWEQTARVPFESEKVHDAFAAESLLAECLHHNSDEAAAVATIYRLELARACQLDQTLYLSLASWWMVFVVGLALRFISRMVVKSTGMIFWRYLSGDRLDVLAYCDENGVVQSPERLPKAVRRHLRNIRWRVSARILGVALAIGSVIAIACVVFSPEIMRPLG